MAAGSNDTNTTPTTEVKKADAVKTANATETVKKKSPKTADDNRMLVWMLLFAAGASAAGVTVYGRKGKTDRS